jgi:hypothetical protein
MPADRSALASSFSRKAVQTIIIIPSSGIAHGEYERAVAFLERELLSRNVRLVSSAVSGRIVSETTGTGESKTESGTPLSDTERLLVLAKKTGADAILQIGSLKWDSTICGLFVLNKDSDQPSFRPATPAEFEAFPGPKIPISCPLLVFSGRLMDVETGEILASFSHAVPASCELPSDYQATYRIKSHHPLLIAENYKITPNAVVWDAAKAKVLDRVLTSVARLLSKKIEQ